MQDQRPGLPSSPTEGRSAVDLYWLPLGAGGHSVKHNGRAYEALRARIEHREPLDLYHAALEVRVPEARFVVEQAPVRDKNGAQRGVVAEGAVGSHWAGAVRRYRAIVGAASTPTPRGRFFVEEALALRPQASGAPFALATSARSTVLQEFGGGPGQIALHGTGNLPGALGAALSHGCIRLSTRAITWLARRIGPAVPLTIVR